MLTQEEIQRRNAERLAEHYCRHRQEARRLTDRVLLIWLGIIIVSAFAIVWYSILLASLS